MKKLFNFLLLVLFFLNFVTSQNNQESKSINDFNFESTTNPAFSLLEETPTQINTPENIKALGLYLSNGFSNSNIALEINPYWFLDHKDKSYESYRGIKKKSKDNIRIDPLNSIRTNSSISLGFIEKKYESIESEKKVIAFGFRTTLFEYYGPKRTKDLIKVVNKLDDGYSNEILEKFNYYLGSYSTKGAPPYLGVPDDIVCKAYINNKTIPSAYINAAQQFFVSYPQYLSVYSNSNDLAKDYFEETSDKVVSFVFNPKKIKPLIRVDGAIAYSVLFKENEFNASTANRFGSWFTADIALMFDEKNYAHIFGISRYVDDGFNINSEGMYFEEDFWDIGGKLELELNKLKVSYEYLRRTNASDKFRSVGNISYQLTEKINIIGGFGKDFQDEDNLVTILGINWGLDLGEGIFSK